jgi:hypothetical protein
MKYLLIQNGSAGDTVLTSSLLGRLESDGHSVHVIAGANGDSLQFSKTYRFDKLPDARIDPNYDLAVNLNPDELGGKILNFVNAEAKVGYGFDSEKIVFMDRSADLHYRARYLGIPSESNLFQLLFGMIGLSWKGEGYNLGYYPKTFQRKSRTGLALKDINLRHFLTDKLTFQNLPPIKVAFKGKVLKQLDELNKCKYVITDDDNCMHMALALKKQVEFIVRRPPVYPIEMFGCGNVHILDKF